MKIKNERRSLRKQSMSSSSSSGSSEPPRRNKKKSDNKNCGSVVGHQLGRGRKTRMGQRYLGGMSVQGRTPPRRTFGQREGARIARYGTKAGTSARCSPRSIRYSAADDNSAVCKQVIEFFYRSLTQPLPTLRRNSSTHDVRSLAVKKNEYKCDTVNWC